MGIEYCALLCEGSMLSQML